MDTMHKTTERIPTWSLCYLINGDASGLTEEETGIVDAWVCNWQVQIVAPVTADDGDIEPYFQISSVRAACRGSGLRYLVYQRYPFADRLYFEGNTRRTRIC